MQIPDFQKQLTAARAGGAFQVSNRWFIFQRKIISEVYGDLKDRDIFYIYLYLCKHNDWKRNAVRKSALQINKDLRYSTSTIKYSKTISDSLKWLEQEGFIEITRPHKQQVLRTSLSIAPDYHYLTKQFVKSDYRLSADVLKSHNHGYVMLPYNAINDAMLANTLLPESVMP